MSGKVSNRTIIVVEIVAAAIFGGAVGYAAYAFVMLPIAASIGTIGFLSCGAALMRRANTPQFTLPEFVVPDFDEADEELLLTDEHMEALVLCEGDRLVRPIAEVEPLILDDILAEMGPESRVVRLFDRKAMPTPGQLRSRIDDHLDHQTVPPPEDASQALSDALAELRRSLR